MAITTSGSVSNTIATDGDLWVGVSGPGSLTVDGGSTQSVTAAGTASVDAEARLWVGRPSAGGGAPVGVGTVTVSGAGSLLEVASGGRADAGAIALVGNGGNGIISVEAGATFRVIDRVGTAYNWSTADGAEALNIGRSAAGTGGDGELSAQGGHVEITGTGAYMNVGRGGATGFVGLYEGSTLALTSTIAAGEATINIGRGSTGVMVANASTITLTGGGAAASNGQDYGAGISVGRDAGGKGSLTLEQGASLTISGDGALAGTPGSYAALQIGRNGGEGSMGLTNSTVTLKDSPEGASLMVGRSDVAGVATKGSLVLQQNSLIQLDSTGFANLGIGRGTGTTGTVSVGGNSVITVQGDLGANLQIGTTNNSVGSTGGTGTLNITGAASAVTFQSDNAGTAAGANIGQFGGTGAVNVDGGTLRFQGAGGTYLNLGFQFDGGQPGNIAAGSAGTASLILTNGAKFYMADGTNASGVRLGGGVGTASVEVRSGSVANLDQGDATGSTYVTVGGGVAGAGVATLLVSGAGSRLEGIGFLGVGFSGENNTTGGNGRLIVENGGRIVTEGNFTVGTGGRLSGNGGTIEMGQNGWGSIADGGWLGDANGAIEKLTIVGGLGLGTLNTALATNARFDISSTDNDQVAVQRLAGSTGGPGGMVIVGATNFVLNVLGGYKFAAGESRAFITSSTNGVISDPFEFNTSTIALNGQHADFSYYLGVLGGGASFGLTALNSGASGGQSTLDFGAFQTLGASYVYRALAGNAEVRGGLFSNTGGLAVGVDAVFGTAAGDTLDASQATQAMALHGLGGNDTLIGGAGDDVLVGGADQDDLNGGLGNDTVIGDDGNDTLRGGDGNDQLFGYEGMDTLFGGVGGDFLAGGNGNDTLHGEDGVDALFGDAGDDILNGGAGNDVLIGGEGINTLNGGDDHDTLIDGSSGSVLNGDAGNDLLYGYAGNDTLNGGVGDDLLSGGDGNDELNGGDGGDALFGEAGDDILNGGLGNDVLIGGEGVNTLNGGDGHDTLIDGSSGSTLSGDEGNDQIFGYGGADTLSGGNGDDFLSGGDGNDLLYGGVGGDVLAGEDGDDQLFGGDGGDNLNGGVGNDLVDGGAGNDGLLGGDGGDTLDGGTGNDYLIGGAGADTFRFLNGTGNDLVVDFSAGPALEDMLDVRAFGFASFGAVIAAASDINGGVYIALDADDSVFLQGLAKAQLVANDFII